MKWLNLFFRFSALVFNLKQKIVQSERWYKAFGYAVLLALTEILFAIISLPLYFIISPEKLYEKGFIFPFKEKSEKKLSTYVVRRKISLVTLGSAAGVYVLKVVLIGAVSLYMLGAPTLLAAVQSWSFDVPADYTYDSAKIEVTGGVARLKDLGGSFSGATTNSGFDTNSTGWAYSSWLLPGNSTNSGTYVATAGNPGGYVNVNLHSTRGNRTIAGMWSQPFTTTVDSPDSATLNLDWRSLTYTSPTAPTTYQLYAFVDPSPLGNPTLGQQVWSSGQITSTTNWASVSTVDIRSKVPTAGTYYVKIAAYVTTPSGNTTYDYTSGFDNVVVNWAKTTHSYDSTTPPINPNTSLTSQKILSWNSFAETATKNGGEIYYQLSSDDGATWQYWNNTAWASAGATNYNTAAVVNTNIGTFTKTANKIRWKAFLSGNGTQQVILDNVAVDYTENTLPSIAALTPSQGISTGKVYINYNLIDNESDPLSLSSYQYSLNGSTWAAMTPAVTDPLHNGITSLTSSPTGVAHTFVWDAQTDIGAVYNTTVQVRLTPNDGVGDGAVSTSSAFTVDYVLPVVTNVVATQTLGGTAVAISYDVSDNTTDNLLVDLEISGDGGLTWTVPKTSATGAVGAGVTAGTGKTITWQAATDYPGHAQNNIQVHVRAKDKFQNQGTYLASSNFSVDTLAPATNVAANLQAQPNAGDSAVLIGGSFTETNPNTNDFYVAVSGGAYGTATAGTVNTASPSNQSTATGTTLDGNSYISKVKITHTDDYGQVFSNENTSPSSAYKYVKPYTPQAPTLSNPVTNNLNLTINPNASEASGLEYSIAETTQSKYVQADGTLGADPVWRTTSAWGTVNVNGLSSPLSQYIFKVKSRNPNDAGHAASSESAFSATSQITNTAPSISFGSIAQTTDGSDYVTINYTATDGQGDIGSLASFQYSTNGSTWTTMTEKTGVGSNGTTNLTFLPTGSNYVFAWDANTDLPTFESNTVSVRLKPNDSLVDGSVATSSNFAVDTKVPSINTVTASQSVGGKTVTINYNLTDGNNSNVTLQISSNGGSSWDVPTTTATGDIGTVTPGNGKTITWNAGVDFDGQFNTNVMVRLRATDIKGNIGAYESSSAFTIDTHSPVVSNVTASQDADAKTFTFHYDVSEDLGNVNVVLAISSDGGSTWTVPITSAVGATGAAIVPGTGKTITWNGATDFNDQEKNNMQIRITATDQYTNVGNTSSSNFLLDTKAPRITSVTGVETLGTTSVSITYNLADQNNSNVEFDISNDGGLTWTVPKTSVTGDFGANVVPGTGKTILWDAKTDFPNQNLSIMQVRVRATDIFTNAASNVDSANFSLDTTDPAVNVAADLKAQPNAGNNSVLVGGSFTEANPSSNHFYVAVSGGVYGTNTIGTADTSTPADQLTDTGVTLKGNDYISKVKIVETDKYGQVTTNENTSPSSAFKYVKPYTPLPPTGDNPTVGTVDVTINKNVDEVDGLEYAIFETTQSKYVQANGTLGASPVWQTIGTVDGHWGSNTGVAGKVNVNGLTTHSYLYQFKVKSRNISDSLNAASSESDLSSGASSTNQSPTIQFNSEIQTTDGTKYVDVNYRGIDLESEASSLVEYQYSTDNVTYHTMTEKAGVGSEGVTGLSFSPVVGTTHHFMWDVGTDLPNTESTTVYVRLQANDGTSSGGQATSSPFTIDTKSPIVSAVTASQITSSGTVTITYTLSDSSNSNVELEISSDGGGSWAVATTSATGNIGAGVVPGAGKTISWNAGADFANQEVPNMQVRVKATDSYSNAGTFSASSNFAVDTKSPVVSNVSAVQNIGSSNVVITYNLADANNSTVYFDVSDNGGSSWNVAAGTLNNVTPGNGKTIGWVAATDYPNQENSNMMIRVRATDAYANAGTNEPSAAFSVDTKAPVISAVSASQVLGSHNVNITYNLSDSGLVNIVGEISSDNGVTWSVPVTTLAGAIGIGQTTENGKTITWNAGTDFANQDINIMKVRIRGTDGFSNASTVESAVFSVDTLAPATSITADVQTQANAGDSVVLIGGAFSETNPSTNNFFVAINGGAYGLATPGTSDTSTPPAQSTNVGATLTGSDYISKVKIVEADKYLLEYTNENTSPSNKYVKPYAPAAPTINAPQNTSVDVTVNPHAGESNSVQYAIYEISSNKYLQSNGTLGAGEVWKTLGTGIGQWGETAGVSGKITVTGLSSPVAHYSFKVKSRNPADAAHQISSESNFSDAVAINNTAPTITINSAAQVTNNNYVIIHYTGTDTQNDTTNLVSYEYSTDNLVWNTMTERSGVGSNGISNLIFSSAGTSYDFAWDIATDLPNSEHSTVYVRLAANDGLASGNLATSSAFPSDTRGPSITNLAVGQVAGSNNFNIGYDVADISGSNISLSLEISSDGGLTWTVPTTTATGDLGSSVTTGVGKAISWNAGVDFYDHEQSDMKVRLRGTDQYGNIGDYAISSNFAVDTKAPVISGVTASQIAGNVVVNYTLSDATVGGNFVEMEASDDDGVTWTVPVSSVSGNIGAGVGAGALSITWNVAADFNNQHQTDIKVRVRARDYFGNQGLYTRSSAFTIDTKAPVVSSVSAVQSTGSGTVTISYTLADDLPSNITVGLDISPDGGLSWSTATTTLTGDVGANQTAGNKTASWNAAEDFGNEDISNTRVRVHATDGFGNINTPVESGDFAVDTRVPQNLTSLSKYASTSDSVTLNWSTPIIDSNFKHYEIWHGSSQSDVDGRTGTATKWSVSNDAALSNILTSSTVISGVSITNNYYAKIWAVDNYGNEATIASINLYTPPPAPATLHIIKSVVNDNDGTATASSFSLHVKLSGVDVSGSPAVGLVAPGTSYSLSAGTYVVSEDANTSYTHTFSGDCDSSGNISLSPSDDKTCTITNNDIPPAPATLHVIKHVVNDNEGTATASSFNLHVKLSGVDVSGSPATGLESPGTSYSLAAGTYAMSEDAFSGYTQSFSGDCDSNGLITLASSDNKTCVITNDDNVIPATATLHIIKSVVNDNEGTATASSFSLHVKLADVDVSGSPAVGLVAPGTSYSLSAGTYVVSEDTNTSYTHTFSGDCDSSGNISLSPSDDKTCTITNNDIPPAPATLHVIKHVINDNDGTATASSFNLHVKLSGVDVSGSPATGLESPGTSYSLSAGTYAMSEDAFPGYTQSFSGDCDSNGFISLASSDNKTCVITNDDNVPVITPEVVAENIIGGGSMPLRAIRQMILPRPLLNSLPNTTSQTNLFVSGIASPGNKIDVYDNDILIGRTKKPADENGRFNQSFNFAEGTHSITAKAINARNNYSDASDPVIFTVILTPPFAPVITSPANNSDISTDTLVLIGTSIPFSTLQITLDNSGHFTTKADANGDWLFSLPNVLSLGSHNFRIHAVDLADNVSTETALVINKLATIPEVVPVLPVPITPSTIIPSQPSPIELITTVENAVTLPGLTPPRVASAQAVAATNDMVSFGGTAQPNQEVVVYIHSDQAIIYNTKADSKGIWAVNHSQNTVELNPGVHTIYAVGLDQQAKVKSLPSSVSQFTITKNFWAVMYSYLNLYTTTFAIVVILLAMFWLHHIRKK